MAATQFTKDVFIAGAGGLGRELFGWTKNPSSRFTVKGFLDDNANILNDFNLDSDCKVCGGISEANLIECGNVILAITKGGVKKRIFDWQQKSQKFIIESFIYPNVIIGINVILGEGVVISPNSLISSFAEIKKGSFINCGSQIGHDVVIGEYAEIMASVNIGGETEIGNNVFIGSSATILPRIKITNDVRIGAGSVVMKNIKIPGTYFGNPAKRIF